MSYKGQTDFRHDAPPCTGILLSNLGTPDAATVPAVRRYLAEFLSDPRVIEMAAPLRWLLLHGVILRLRPGRSAHAYQRIWSDEGSPLYVISRKQAAAIEQHLQGRFRGEFRLELAMRYGRPSIASALEKLREHNVQRLLVFPLYPQYSSATTGSTFDAVSSELRRWRWIPEVRLVNQYCDDEEYLAALAESIREHQSEHGKPDRLLFSFHGLPKSYVLAGDPYYCQCRKTARLAAAQLGLADDAWEVSFQSRLGPREWLKPYTDKLLKKWAKQGVGHVQVICPGFSADCLETLEEVAMQDRDTFIHAGGKKYSYIPALNDRQPHIEALCGIIERHCRGWRKYGAEGADQDQARELEETRRRAQAAGAAN